MAIKKQWDLSEEQITDMFVKDWLYGTSAEKKTAEQSQRILKGKWTELKDFFQFIYQDKLGKSPSSKTVSKTFLRWMDGPVQGHFTRVATSVDALMVKGHDMSHFTPSTFWHHKSYAKEHLLWMTAIILDLDFGKTGTGPVLHTPDDAYAYIHKTIGLKPAFVWPTRTIGNYQVAFLIKPLASGKNSKRIALYEYIAKSFAQKVGADEATATANHMFRIPHKGVWQYDDHIYNLDELKKVIPQGSFKREEKGEVVYLEEERLHRNPAIKKLLSGDIESNRNHAAFTAALFFYAIGVDEEEALDHLLNAWLDGVNNGRFRDTFTQQEVKTCVKSAYSGKYHGPKKEWIEKLTGESFQFDLYKSNIREKRYHKAEDIYYAILQYVQVHGGNITVKQEELAKAIDKPYRSVKKVLAEMQRQGILSCETKRGRYSEGTTIELRLDELAETVKSDAIICTEGKCLEGKEKDSTVMYTFPVLNGQNHIQLIGFSWRGVGIGEVVDRWSVAYSFSFRGGP